MSRDWKPGDVAMGRHGIAFCAGGSDHLAWTFVDGSGGFRVKRDGTWESLQPEPPMNARRLVVIDPEDDDEVKRFDGLLSRFVEGDEVPHYEGTVGATRAALREFANPTPPKPDEPQGLGAVVEDTEGDRWVRSTPRVADFTWIHEDGERSRPWRTLDAVRVLSEGVTP